jgi:hypothetical protein
MMDNMSKPEYEQFDEYPRLRALLETKDKEDGKEFLRGIIRKQTIDTREEYADVLMAFGKVLPFKDEDLEVLGIISELEKLFPSLTKSIPAPHPWWTRLLGLKVETEEECHVEWPVK